MISLYYEEIPKTQWATIYFLVIVMLAGLMTIPSQGLIVESFLKAAFVCAILCVLMLLSRLNNLALFED